MFSGIVEEMGQVIHINKLSEQALQLKISGKQVLEDIRLGDSIAVDGVCLTATSFEANSFTVDVMPETMQATTLNQLRTKHFVNLERSLNYNGRIGGHMLTGHVDGVGLITNKYKKENAIYYEVKLNKQMIDYLIIKGSIAIDGISLTVFKLDKQSEKVTVSLISHTLKVTSLGKKEINDSVNIEIDMLAKYIKAYLKEDVHV